MADPTFSVTVALIDGEPTITEIKGPPSLTAIVDTTEAIIEIALSNQLPTDWQLGFDSPPLRWHNFGEETEIPQPSWISAGTPTDSLTLTDENSAANGSPVIAQFRAKLVATNPDNVPIQVEQGPDPTIINVDPVGN